MSFDKVGDGVVGKNFEMLRGFRGVVRSKVGEEGLFVHAWKLKFGSFGKLMAVWVKNLFEKGILDIG